MFPSFYIIGTFIRAIRGLNLRLSQILLLQISAFLHLYEKLRNLQSITGCVALTSLRCFSWKHKSHFVKMPGGIYVLRHKAFLIGVRDLPESQAHTNLNTCILSAHKTCTMPFFFCLGEKNSFFPEVHPTHASGSRCPQNCAERHTLGGKSLLLDLSPNACVTNTSKPFDCMSKMDRFQACELRIQGGANGQI